MKKFGLFVLKMFLVGVFIGAALDGLYTYLYTNKIDATRIDFIKSQSGKKFDHVFIGSSRVVNHINPDVIDSITGGQSVNFGIMDAKPQDILIIIKLLDYYKIEVGKLYIQTDYYYNSIDKSNFLFVDLLPYIKEGGAFSEYYSNEDDYFYLRNLPFYRYAKSDAKLGLRSLLAAAYGGNKFEKNKGFVPLIGSGHAWQRELPERVKDDNPYNQEIQSLLEKMEINYLYFVAPFRSDTKNIHFIEKLTKRYEAIWDFSQLVPESEKFKNGYHLNYEGANEFSAVIANRILEQ
ncbi:MAG: hypothetical protein H6584_07325 [Flavobacteriales bacterium]|nr:hypothetical protein [Flavobacteriales bacterium]